MFDDISGLERRAGGMAHPFRVQGVGGTGGFKMTFDSVDAFQAVFAPNVETFQNDVPNYTDIEPTVQVSEVKL